MSIIETKKLVCTYLDGRPYKETNQLLQIITGCKSSARCRRADNMANSI